MFSRTRVPDTPTYPATCAREMRSLPSEPVCAKKWFVAISWLCLRAAAVKCGERCNTMSHPRSRRSWLITATMSSSSVSSALLVDADALVAAVVGDEKAGGVGDGGAVEKGVD